MKTYDVWVTEFAEKSIRKIAKYMAKELMNSEAAISFLNNVSEDIYSLRRMPGRFSLIQLLVANIRPRERGRIQFRIRYEAYQA